MLFILLLYADESGGETPAEMPPERSAQWEAFHETVSKVGALIRWSALHPSTTATTIRVRDDKTLISDGPFAETKEQLGGFYMLECADLDEAIAYASRMPCSPHGSVEIRPVLTPENS